MKKCISFFGFMITENFTMIEKLLEVLEILVLTLNKKRISLTSKTIHWGFWVNLYGEKEYVEGVQSFWLIQMKANLWKECKDGKGLVTEIYYGWTGGYPYMKVIQSNKHFFWDRSDFFQQMLLFKCCSLLCTAWRQNCRQLRRWFQSLWITMTLPVFIINYNSIINCGRQWPS